MPWKLAYKIAQQHSRMTVGAMRYVWVLLPSLLVAAASEVYTEKQIRSFSSPELQEILIKAGRECKACSDEQLLQEAMKLVIKDGTSPGKGSVDGTNELSQEQYANLFKDEQGMQDLMEDIEKMIKMVQEQMVPEIDLQQESLVVTEKDQIISQVAEQENSFETKPLEKQHASWTDKYWAIAKHVGSKYGNAAVVNGETFFRMFWKLLKQYAIINMERAKKLMTLASKGAVELAQYSFKKSVEFKDYAGVQYRLYMEQRKQKSAGADSDKQDYQEL